MAFNTVSMFNGSNWNNGASAGVSTTLSWNVQNVVNMNNMFLDNDDFNANISEWKPTALRFMNKTFMGASAFNNGFPAGSVGTATISNTLDWNMPNLNNLIDGALAMLLHLIRI